MRFVIQRVESASVTVDNGAVSSIQTGFVVLCGYRKEDDPARIPRMVEKCLNLRVFEDNRGKMNLSIMDVVGELLVVSQFTLYADCRHGRRPGFDLAMPPSDAEQMFQKTVEEFRHSGLKTVSGIFAAKMKITLINNGPVTIILDDQELF